MATQAYATPSSTRVRSGNIGAFLAGVVVSYIIFLTFPTVAFRQLSSSQSGGRSAQGGWWGTNADNYFKRDGQKECKPRNPMVLVYNRIPKAGSTTMRLLLEKLAERNGFVYVRPFPRHNHTVAADAIFEALISKKKTLVEDHFAFPEIGYSTRVDYINVVRDPADRTISTYYYDRYGDRPPGKAEAFIERFGDLSLDDCIFKETEFKGHCLPRMNDMARYFCGREGHSCQKDKKLMREKSRQAMDTFYTVGVLEDLERSLQMFEKRFPSFFKHAISIYSAEMASNVNNKRGNASDAAIEYLIGQQDIDYMIYNKAKDNQDAFHEHCL